MFYAVKPNTPYSLWLGEGFMGVEEKFLSSKDVTG